MTRTSASVDDGDKDMAECRAFISSYCARRLLRCCCVSGWRRHASHWLGETGCDELAELGEFIFMWLSIRHKLTLVIERQLLDAGVLCQHRFH